jgi:hypothetical protein
MPFLRAEAIEMLTGPYKLYLVSLSYLIIHFGIGFAQQSPHSSTFQTLSPIPA